MKEWTVEIYSVCCICSLLLLCFLWKHGLTGRYPIFTQVDWFKPSIDKRKVRKVARCSHQNLEEVEVFGYYGRKSELELVIYLLENAVALKKIIIDPHNPFLPDRPKKIGQIEKEKAARVRAKRQLKGRVTVGIELVIL
ncbi:unnamed protein product [Ilex paraguariensis]|uniref:FBD domain-containing protein n=1 Tax=Ilex paraguariensis TaxID=185542 RepID=A0ABC8URG1_9AQUA